VEALGWWKTCRAWSGAAGTTKLSPSSLSSTKTLTRPVSGFQRSENATPSLSRYASSFCLPLDLSHERGLLAACAIASAVMPALGRKSTALAESARIASEGVADMSTIAGGCA
jgi:hypothetical protein